MSQLILPNRKTPVNIEFNVAVMPTGDMAIQATWSGGMIQLPPVAPEIIAGIAEHLGKAAEKVLAKQTLLNEQILTANGAGAEGF